MISSVKRRRDFGGGAFYRRKKNEPYETGNMANKIGTCISQLEIAVTNILGAFYYFILLFFLRFTARKLVTIHIGTNITKHIGTKNLQNFSRNQFAVVVPRRASVEVSTAVGCL
jgi:hypothetical protein